MKDLVSRNLSRPALIFALLALAGPAWATPPGPLNEDEQQALQVITEGRITTTVSFLASDELGGRDTPSPGLDIAAAYVAARFRGAGLQGLGDDGGFFQGTSVTTVQTPTAGVHLTTGDGTAVPQYGMLVATDRPVRYEGNIPVLDDVGEDQKFSGPVAMNEVVVSQRGPGGSLFALAGLGRQITRARSRGATAALVHVGENSPLLQLAASYRARARMPHRRNPISIPVLLVPAPRLPAGPLTLHLPAHTRGAASVRNVVAVLRGGDPELGKQAIVVSAHLDHIGRSEGAPDPVNNGADDDASGVTAVLSLADAFAALRTRPKRSVVFIAFWGEEKGLRGSYHFVAHPPWPLDQIVANVNIEMIGRPEPDARQNFWMTGWEKSNLGELMAQGAQRIGVRVFEHPQFSAMLYRRSDNWPFAEKGVIAHSFSAGSLHPDYHQPSDEWEKLDIPHMTRVVQGIFAATLPMAHGTATPSRR